MKKTILAISTLTFLSALSAQIDNDLATTDGHEIGLTGSRYIYREPRFMSTRGYKLGIEYTGTFAQEKWFGKLDFRYAGGQVKYDGSGTRKGDWNYYYDLRFLVGKDLEINKYLFAPHIGFGYRYLFHDNTWTTSTDHLGYTRESLYWYIPVGLTHRMNLANQANLETTVEYNHFIKGKQYSDNLENNQSKGYGFRLSTAYNKDNWSVGPFYQYWKIKDSDVNHGIYEPKNHTSEFGIRLRYKF